jgi:hypothetical protein
VGLRLERIVPEKSTAQKLLIRPGSRFALVNAPGHVTDVIGELPSGAVSGTDPSTADTVLLFAANRAELAREWPAVSASISPSASLWIAYPKKSGSIQTDLSRDHGWEPIVADGFDTVSLVAIDGIWSALRFRRDPKLRAERAARGRPRPGQSVG